MGSLLDAKDRESILARLAHLKPDARPLWGRFTPGAMICHVTTGVGQGLGEVQLDPPSGPFTHWPLNWLVIYLVPFPRNAKAAPDMLRRVATSFDADMSTLRGMIGRYANQDPKREWPESRVFGRISGRSWGVLQYKHLDHHLRQFGL